ncbi:hypothetical protein GF366_01155 [Candidatus Peregrinibacteria bacterium]|nr:hypothetical protein [Candidatus Peregrinibacteria bacterium]
MCRAIRFNRFEFSDKELKAHGFEASGSEIRVSFNSKSPLLPVHYRGKNIFLPWGNKGRFFVPKTYHCRLKSLKAGKWRYFNPEPVIIIVSFGLINGVWFQVRQGMKGIFIKDKPGHKFCYIITRPSTHYFRVMTGSRRMPVLLNQIL